MNKAFDNFQWENYPSMNTALDKENLNKVNRGINEVDNRVISLDTTKFDKADAQGLIKNITFDLQTGILKKYYYNGSTEEINTGISKLNMNLRFDKENQILYIVNADGTEDPVDLSVFITNYEFNDSDTIAHNVSANGTVTSIVKDGSIQEKHLQPNYLADIKVEVANAESFSNSAGEKATEAGNYAKQAQSYAVGTGNARPNEAEDNAKRYYEKSKEIFEDFNSSGSVTGVKGNEESTYRTGLVNITPENIGAKNEIRWKCPVLPGSWSRVAKLNANGVNEGIISILFMQNGQNCGYIYQYGIGYATAILTQIGSVGTANNSSVSVRIVKENESTFYFEILNDYGSSTVTCYLEQIYFSTGTIDSDERFTQYTAAADNLTVIRVIESKPNTIIADKFYGDLESPYGKAQMYSSWTMPVTIGQWNRIGKTGFGVSSGLFVLRFQQNAQAQEYNIFLSTTDSTVFINQVSATGYKYGTNVEFRVTRSATDACFYIEVKNNFKPSSSVTTTNAYCSYLNLKSSLDQDVVFGASGAPDDNELVFKTLVLRHDGMATEKFYGNLVGNADSADTANTIKGIVLWSGNLQIPKRNIVDDDTSILTLSSSATPYSRLEIEVYTKDNHLTTEDWEDDYAITIIPAVKQAVSGNIIGAGGNVFATAALIQSENYYAVNKNYRALFYIFEKHVTAGCNENGLFLRKITAYE